MFFLFFIQIESRIQTIHLFYGYISTDTQRFILGVCRLIIIEITIGIGRHNYIMSHLCRFYASRCSAPWHYCRIGGYIAFQNFVPADNPASLAVQELLDTCHAITLQAIFCGMFFISFQPFRFDTCLAFRTFFPTGTWSFIATDMYIFWWEYFDDFTHYVFQELHGFIITDAEYVFKYAPTRTYFIWTACTSHFRISG